MRRTISAVAAVSLIGAMAAIHSAGRAQNVTGHAAPEDCQWRKERGGYTLYCNSAPFRISPEEAERDRMLAQSGLVRVRPPEWDSVSAPAGFDETTVDRANAGDAAAMRMVGVFHLSNFAPGKAAPWLQKAAAAGDPEAALRLGMLYNWGHAVPHDDGRAVEWFLKAAGKGDLWAMHWLGELYLTGGKGLAKDEAQAARWFRPAAEAGDAAAMFRLAGLSRDPAEARSWLERSARGGFEAAGTELKRLGRAVPAETPVAPIDVPSGPPPECKIPAALKGSPLIGDLSDPDNERNLATFAGDMAGDKEAAFCFSRRAALRGSGYAAIDLAEAYSTGRGGAPGSYPMPMFQRDNSYGLAKDDAQALRWYALTARAKDQYIPGQAMSNVGDFYAAGVAVPRNDVEAVRWYRRAGAADAFIASQPLAFMYHGGFGVVRDDREAMRVLLGDIGLATNRAIYGAMIANGMPSLDEKWTADAIGWAAQSGYVEAMIAFGQRLASGDGFEKDLPEARRCLALAASLGEPRAAAELAKLPKAEPGEHSPEHDFMSAPVPVCRA